MNEQLQAKLVEILSAIQAGTKAAGDFAMEQLPDIAQQYVVYGRATALLYVLASLAAFAAALFVALKCGYLNRSAVYTEIYKAGEWYASRCLAAVAGSFASFFSLLFLVNSLSNAFLAWFAPKVWLIKELASLAR